MGRGSPPLDCRAGLSSVESGKLGHTLQGIALFGKEGKGETRVHDGKIAE